MLCIQKHGGDTWKNDTNAPDDIAWWGVTYGGGKFVAVAESALDTNSVTAWFVMALVGQWQLQQKVITGVQSLTAILCCGLT